MKIKVGTPLVFLLVSAYVFYFAGLSIYKFYTFGFHDFDLAVHSLSVWNILHGSISNSILGIPFLGNHFNLILFLIAPLYFFFQSPLTLLLLQTLALGLGALPLYFLSLKFLDKKWAILVVLGYLFYPPLAYTNLFEFHPPAFATFFLIMAVFYYEQSSLLKFMFFSVLAMLCQENIPLAVAMFGGLALIDRRKIKWIIVPVLTGTIYFIAAIMIMGLFNNNTIQFFGLYSVLGKTPVQVFSGIFMHPDLIIRLLLRKECLTFVFNLFLPLLFIPCFGFLRMLPALPFLMQHMLSSRATEVSIFYHYTAEIIPFIFISLIYGIKFLLTSKTSVRPLFLKISLALTIFLSSVYFGPYFKILPMVIRHGSMYQDKQLFALKIPPKSSVVSTFEFLPHLTERRSLYSLHHVYLGYYTLSNKPYALPEGVEYALIDFNDPLTFSSFYRKEGYRKLQKFISSGNWQAQGFLDTIVLFNKNSLTGMNICQAGAFSDSEIKNKVVLNVEGAIELTGYTFKEYTREGILGLTFYWRSLKETEKDINILLDIVDRNDNLLMRKIRPICYRIFPTNSWHAQEVFKEFLRIRMPLPRRDYKIKIVFFDYATGLVLKVNAPVDYLGRAEIMDVR